MRRLSKDDKSEIKYIITEAAGLLTRFKASFDVLDYSRPKTNKELSQLADELHSSNYPIGGTGIRASRSLLTAKDSHLSEYIIRLVPLAPESHVDELLIFPLHAAAASYIFSILEVTGNTVVKIISPNAIPARSSWHAKVWGGTDVNVPADLLKARKGIAAPFSVNPSRIPILSAKRLIWLKAQRNEYAHDLNYNIDFERFFITR